VTSGLYNLKKKEIEEIFKRGKAYRGDFLILRINKNSLPFSRWSFIVPASSCQEAVKRNRLKRQLRENIREKLAGIKSGVDGIVLALPDVIGRTHEAIDKEVDKLLNLAGVLRQN